MPSKRRRARRDRENTGGPSPAWIGSAVLLGLVAVALVVVLIHAAVSPKAATPAAASPPGATPGAAPSAGVAPAPGGAPASANAGQEGRPAGCSTTGSDQTVPTSPPTGVTWSLTAGFAVPSSVADGPTLHGPGGVRYCYSHTPLGAVLAASNLGQGTGSPQEIQDASLNCRWYRINTPRRLRRPLHHRATIAAAASSLVSGSFPTPRIRPALRWLRASPARPTATPC